MPDVITLCGGPCPNCPEATFEQGSVTVSEHGQSVTLSDHALRLLVEEAKKRGLLLEGE